MIVSATQSQVINTAYKCTCANYCMSTYDNEIFLYLFSCVTITYDYKY